jgi:hypothetical protein
MADADEEEEPNEEYVDSAMSQKIFQTAHLQQKQLRDELGEEGASDVKVKFQSVDNDDDSDVEEVWPPLSLVLSVWSAR